MPRWKTFSSAKSHLSGNLHTIWYCGKCAANAEFDERRMGGTHQWSEDGHQALGLSGWSIRLQQ
jgi:hypothetical protein